MKIETDINKLTSETHNNLFVNTGCWAQNYTNISPVEVNAFSILTSKMDMAYRNTPLLSLTLHLGIGNYSLENINFQKFKCWATLQGFSENKDYEINK